MQLVGGGLNMVHFLSLVYSLKMNVENKDVLIYNKFNHTISMWPKVNNAPQIVEWGIAQNFPGT
jgi:hypothetical protein